MGTLAVHSNLDEAIEIEVIDFKTLRSDWYHGVEYMVTLLRRSAVSTAGGTSRKARRPVFKNFPRQWIPLFEWIGARWDGSSEPANYVPFASSVNEEFLVREVAQARRQGQLRLLVELLAGSDAVMAEALPRLDGRLGDAAPSTDMASIRLTNWHS